ncbi:MAG: hypothetical protein J6M43_00350 [Neisseriaceae bacterium]|nr:hypothetical protein [Neisseriaceae bacterium]
MASLVVGTIYYGLMFILAGFFLLLALIFPKKAKGFFITAGCVVVLFVVVIPLWARLSLKIMEIKERPIKEAAEKRYNEARAVFDEQCKKAGEKIYRTVDNVDGVMLLKARRREDLEEHERDKGWGLTADPMYSHAAIAELEIGDYIGSFLGNSGENYSFVDILEKDGSISRYKYNKVKKDEEIVEKNPSNPARYALTYENNVDPALRKHWVAGITIKILDRQTDELLAEKTIFTFESGLGSTATGRQPWLHLPEHCPELSDMPTRAFAFQVLKFSQPLNSQE